jgi:DNA primase
MTESGEFKEIVKQQADIVRIVGDYIKLRKSGGQNYVGLCPFHGEKTPSFSVHATRQFYHCFGCGVSGDVFSFVQKVENISFPESVRLVAQKLGIPLPKATFSSEGEARDSRLRAQLLDAQEQAAAFFQDCLRRPEGASAREYLIGRGLDQETIARFRIGYAPDSGFLLRDRLAKNFEENALRESGLFSWKEAANSEPRTASEQQVPDRAPLTALYSKFRNRVMFPIANDSGRIIAFTGRTLATDEKAGPKYLNSPETGIYSKGRVLFNLDLAKDAIRKLDYAILVEGQMDCISVYAAGFHNVLASSGTAFTEVQAKLLGRFSKNVVVNFDPDTAGAKATERTLGLLVEEEFNIRVLTLEQGFDPDLYIRRKGKDSYSEALRASQKYFDYLIDRARTNFPVRSPEGKKNAVNYLLPHIQRVPNAIVRDELAQEMAQKLGIDSAVLRQELRHVATSRSAAAVKPTAEVQATDAERILIRALATRSKPAHGQFSDAADFNQDDFGSDPDFDPAGQAQSAFVNEELHRGLATESLVEAMLNAGPEVADVMEVHCSESERRMLASILLKEEEELTAESLDGALRALRRIRLRRQLEQVQRELNQPGVSGDKELRNKLLFEKDRLSRVLRDPVLAESGPGSSGNQKTA